MKAHHELRDGVSETPPGIDLLTRYFLRRLAMARRKGLYTDRRAEYSDALVEVIIVAIAAPVFGILSFVVVLSLKWLTPSEVASLPIPSKWAVVIGGWIFCVIIGRLLFGRKFKRFLSDPGAALMFDTERDREIAGQIKFMAIAIGGFVAPAAALIIAFWNRL